MSGLSNFELLEVNATIIVGLVLLFTFQSFSSILPPDYNSYFEDLSAAYGEYYKIEGVLDECLQVKGNPELVQNDLMGIFLDKQNMDEYMPYHEEYAKMLVSDFENKCNGLFHDYASAYQNITGLLDYGNIKGYIPDYIFESESGIFAGQLPDVPTTSANVLVVLTTIVMIMPFTISSIVAIQHASKTKLKDESSKVALRILLVGFIVMTSGFLYIGYLFFNFSGSG